MLHSVLLVESDPETIRDVGASLRLVNIPVTVVHSVEEAKTSLGVARPTVILTRFSVEGDAEIAHHLAQLLQADSGLCSIPLALIATQSERAVIGAGSSLFRATLPLPVEFPSFTHRVQELLDMVSVPPPPAAAPEPAPVREVKTLGRVAASYDRKLVCALALQHEVLERLRRDPGYAQLRADEIPGKIAELTSEICRSYDVEKLFR